MVFIDFKKAFDSVHRSLLMKILRAYGIPEAIVGLIEGIYCRHGHKGCSTYS